jgi:5-methylcytosine-specific restriction endonuclease McrA
MKEKHQERKTWRKGYNSENIERVRQWKVDWRNNNLEKSLEIERSTRKRLIAKDPVGFRERAGLWQKNNPDKVRVKLARRRGRERQAEGEFTAEDVKSLYKAQDGKCAYCFIDLGKKYHVDHIKPLIRGGSNWPDNLQLCCPTCNISKGAKDHGEFMQYLGRSV